MNVTVKSTTKREDLDAYTVQQLKEDLQARGMKVSGNKETAADRLWSEAIRPEVDALQAAEKAAIEQKEAALAAESAEDHWVTVKLQQFAEKIGKYQQDQQDAIESIAAEIAANPLQLSDKLRWKAMEVFYRTALYRTDFANMSGFFKDQLEQRTNTHEEIVTFVKRFHRKAMDNVMSRTDFEHRSTCPLSVAQGQMEFKAMQANAKNFAELMQCFVDEYSEERGADWMYLQS